VVARVGAILRRLKQPAAKTSGSASLPALQHGNLRIDSDGFKAYWGELEITLTVTEFNILSTLARRPGKVFTRDELMEGAYEDSRYVSDRTIDSHVRRIRKKFMARGGDPIETRRGVGYLLTACD
jgi:two-component system OmpR family response regulator